MMARRFRTLASFTLAAVLAAPYTSAADDPMFATFVEVKSLYKTKRFEDAELALRRMSELLAAPEYEKVRPTILPAFQFYSAAVAWELKKEDNAKTAIQQYFALSPNAELDRSMYPKRFAQFFEVEKEKFDKRSIAENPVAPQSPAGLLSTYATFAPDVSAIPQYSGAPDWASSPVKFILTPKDKEAFAKLGDEESRRDWVAAFWRGFDPDPLTPANEFQEEFFRRVQYADANFSTEQTKGSLSDRGMVFIVLGPPTFSGRGRLKGNDDPLGSARHTIRSMDSSSGQVSFITAGESAPTTRGSRSQAKTPVLSGGYVPGSDDGVAESWTYRDPHLPKGLPYTELTFQFFTRKGYGDAVLQKEPRQLTAIGKAITLLRSPASGS
jgi:GWxTD domain-containing protein